MKNICKAIISLYLLILYSNFTGCTTVPVKPEKLSLPTVVQTQTDQIGILVREIGNKSTIPKEKIVAYINVDLVEVFPTPKKTKAIEHIERGNKVFIFDVKDDWANISADENHEYWINLSQICLTQKCWQKRDTSSRTSNSANKIYTYQKRSTSNVNQYTPSTSNGKGYINSKGNYVPSPRKSNQQPSGATAKCRDGSWSFSQSTRGTCSRHGGVSSWL